MSQIVQMTDVAKDYLDGVRPDDGHITLTINGGDVQGLLISGVQLMSGLKKMLVEIGLK